MDVKESDWKLYRKNIGHWQESYMASLVKEYLNILSDDSLASDKFWTLEKRIKLDKKKPGVSIELRRSTMLMSIIELILDGAITLDDISDFSDEFIEEVSAFLERRRID